MELRCLPEPGGLLDQSVYWIERLKAVLTTRAELESIKADREEARRDAQKNRPASGGL